MSVVSGLPSSGCGEEVSHFHPLTVNDHAAEIYYLLYHNKVGLKE